mmetsp:Transcript_928/g.3503  ORF Transcript_928/g.3503 Transcript_928/m.3503 type:complete len:346 (+) Transcript_928:1668-2705(+)
MRRRRPSSPRSTAAPSPNRSASSASGRKTLGTCKAPPREARASRAKACAHPQPQSPSAVAAAKTPPPAAAAKTAEPPGPPPRDTSPPPSAPSAATTPRARPAPAAPSPARTTPRPTPTPPPPPPPPPTCTCCRLRSRRLRSASRRLRLRSSNSNVPTPPLAAVAAGPFCCADLAAVVVLTESGMRRSAASLAFIPASLADLYASSTFGSSTISERSTISPSGPLKRRTILSRRRRRFCSGAGSAGLSAKISRRDASSFCSSASSFAAASAAASASSGSPSPKSSLASSSLSLSLSLLLSPLPLLACSSSRPRSPPNSRACRTKRRWATERCSDLSDFLVVAAVRT